MAGLNSEIDSLKHEIDRTDSELALLYTDLGRIACDYHRAIGCTESNAVFDEICSLVQLYDEIDGEMEKVRTALEQKDASDREIRHTETTVKELDNQRRTLLASLGAVAAEAYEAGRLPGNLERCLVSVNNCKSRLAAVDSGQGAGTLGRLGFRRFGMRKSQRLMAKLDSAFHDAGRKIFENYPRGAVPGERAQEIYAQLDELSSARRSYRSLLGEKKAALSKAEGSLQSMGGVADASKILRDCQAREKELQLQLDEKFTEYGRIISRSMDTWLDSQAPQDLRLACERLSAELKRRERQNLNMDYYDIEKEINIHRVQVEQLEGQIKLLEQQRAAVEKQIQDLDGRARKERSAILELRDRQAEITRLAADIVSGA